MDREKTIETLDSYYLESFDNELDNEKKTKLIDIFNKLVSKAEKFLVSGIKFKRETRFKFLDIKRYCTEEIENISNGCDVLITWPVLRELL